MALVQRGLVVLGQRHVLDLSVAAQDALARIVNVVPTNLARGAKVPANNKKGLIHLDETHVASDQSNRGVRMRPAHPRPDAP
jgi:hypothetical protein